MAKRRKGKKPKATNQILSPAKYIRMRGRDLKIHEIWISDDWKENGMANVILVREHPQGNKTLALVLVDLYCLGVKECYYLFNLSDFEYNNFLDEYSFMNLQSVSYEMAHNIVYGAIEFAEDYGFHPYKDWKVVQYLFEEDDERIPFVEIEFGQDGKPFYFYGPNDSTVFQNKVIRTLEKTAGEGNFDYFLETDEYDVDNNEEDSQDEFDEEELYDFSLETMDKIVNGEIEPNIFQTFILVCSKYRYDFEIAEGEMTSWDELTENLDISEYAINDEKYNEFLQYSELHTDLEEATDLKLRKKIFSTESGNLSDKLLELFSLFDLKTLGLKKSENELVDLVMSKFRDNILIRISLAQYLNDLRKFDGAWRILGENYLMEKSFPQRYGEFSLTEFEFYLIVMCNYLTHTKNFKVAIPYGNAILNFETIKFGLKEACLLDLTKSLIKEINY